MKWLKKGHGWLIVHYSMPSKCRKTNSKAEWGTINSCWEWPNIGHLTNHQSVKVICGNKMPIRCNRGFYCRSYCLFNMFRAQLCPSSGAQEYYTVVTACSISCCGLQVAGLVQSWGLCVLFAGCRVNQQASCIILLSSWWWAQWCPKHVEQAIRSAIKTSVACSWHFISTY